MIQSEKKARIPVVQRILSANDQAAEENRRILEEHGIVAFNLMASPGAGKTTLIMATIEALKARQRIGVVEGDVASQVDADRIATTGAPVVQINTGGACHLDAPTVNGAFDELPLGELDMVFVENVGNLICPVSFDLGQTYRVALLSVPEGDDKPYKYPAIFEAVDVVVITKADLLGPLDFDLDAFLELMEGVNPTAPVFALSAETGEGMEDWLAWVEERVLPLEG